MGRLRKNINDEKKVLNNLLFFINSPSHFKGKWNKEIFKNDYPIYLEIGTGKGKFLTQLALLNSNINFIASDKYLTILYKTINKAIFHKLNNFKIINLDAINLLDIFADNEVSKIYLNFSDPWPKKRHYKRRLTHINFLNIFFRILKDKQTIEFKTDNYNLFLFTLDQIKILNLNIIFISDDLYNSEYFLINEIKTEYEEKWLKKNLKIYKIIFSK